MRWQRERQKRRVAVDVAEETQMDDMYAYEMGGGHIGDYPSAFWGISVSASEGNNQFL